MWLQHNFINSCTPFLAAILGINSFSGFAFCISLLFALHQEPKLLRQLLQRLLPSQRPRLQVIAKIDQVRQTVLTGRVGDIVNTVTYASFTARKHVDTVWLVSYYTIVNVIMLFCTKT